MEGMTYKEELEHYKKTIDICDYLEKSGYTIDKERDTPRYRAYTNQETKDKVYVPKRSKSEIATYYVNQYDNDDKGTLIDFVMSREQKNLNEARLTLREFQNGYVPSKEQPSLSVDERKEKRQQYVVEKIAKEYPSGVDEVYLEKRLLSASTRHDPAFQGKIKLNEAADERFVAFPIENERGKVIGLAMKSPTKERFLGKRAGVWISNPTLNQKNVDKVVITEHPIDAMSYHQIHQLQLHKQNVVYFSTAGNPSKKQMEVLQTRIASFQPKEIVLANDNDPAGRKYDEKYQHVLRSADIPIHLEKSQFKDWNADIYAGVIYQNRLLDRQNNQPAKIQSSSRIKATPEVEEMIRVKNYQNLTDQQKQELPSYYIERRIDGKRVEFSLQEVALINNDRKLITYLGQTLEENKINHEYIATKTGKFENSVHESAELKASIKDKPEDHQIKNQRVSEIHHQSKIAQQALREADNHVQDQPINHQPGGEPNERQVTTQTDEFSEVQKEYNHQIDFLQQRISGKPEHEQMSRKLYYYKHYPHLNDQEVDTYLSIEDKMKSQEQDYSHNLDRQKDREIGT